MSTDAIESEGFEHAPWPFAADKARRELDTDLIESHAVDIVGRALATNRLVVFAGAGLAMAYGRMTWIQLLELLFDKTNSSSANDVEKHALMDDDWDVVGRKKTYKKLAQTLWGNKRSEFRKNPGTYVVTAQLFADALSEMFGRHFNFHDWVSDKLKNHNGRMSVLLGPLHTDSDSGSSGPGFSIYSWNSKAPEDIAILLKKLMAGYAATSAEQDSVLAHAPPTNRPGIISFINEYIKNIVDAAAVSPNSYKRLRTVYQTSYLPLLSLTDSPLDILINGFGIKRFLTTNYDHEIERALCAFDYPDQDERLDSMRVAGHGTWHRAISLEQATTGQAVSFAVEGNRRHAQVLHLHGESTKPQDLIVTEADYQRMYLEESETHDLVENSVRALFGANPILFVGSNVGEDDIMRPLRQFVTGTPHRRDRMAVALLPSLIGNKRVALQRLDLLIRYGVHSIHYGYLNKHGTNPINFLQIVDDCCKNLEKVSDQSLSKEWKKCVRTAGSQARRLKAVGSARPTAQGDFDKQRNAMVEALIALHKRVEQFLAKRSRAPNQMDDWTGRRLRMAAEELRSAFITLFLCAELTSLQARAFERTEKTRKLPNIWKRPRHDIALMKSQGKDRPLIFFQYGISIWRENYLSWFAGGQLESRIEKELREPMGPLRRLHDLIMKETAFRIRARRRVLVISARRGAGKGALFDSLRYRRRLGILCRALGQYDNRINSSEFMKGALIFHINLTFSNDIGPALTHVSETILQVCAPAAARLPPKGPPVSQDQIEILALALEALEKYSTGRCLLILGNAGVLFDDDGEAKNGQIRRIFQVLSARAYESAKLDIVMFCSESQVPSAFRWRDDDPGTNAIDAIEERKVPVLAGPWLRSSDLVRSSTYRIMRRRQLRLNLTPPPASRSHTLLYGLEPLRAEQLWYSFFSLGLPKNDAQQNEVKSLLVHVYRAAGANRMAMTLIFAYVRLGRHGEIAAQLRSIVQSLHGCTPEMAVERVTAVVLDLWFQRHLRLDLVTSERIQDPKWITPSLFARADCLFVELWNLTTEILWTLSVLSQPADANVLMGCESIVNALRNVWLAFAPETKPKRSHLQHLLNQKLEQLVRWCLIFRIERRPMYSRGSEYETTENCDYRYSTHRQIQRHFLSLSGGRRVETTRWDQLTTTLYASQPDELPALPQPTHQKLVLLVRSLSRYPRAFENPTIPFDTPERLRRLRERLRAAYSLVSASFSLGVIARSPEGFATSPKTRAECGALEEYRRLIRWIILKARELDDRRQRGVFYPGELLWLYSECGVIALAQGKLDQAEDDLALAERAARNIENDSTGSMHVRVRLNMALAQIERGHSSLARTMLLPISQRRGGHPVPSHVARFYLGLIDHLSGNYTAADDHYRHAATGLRAVGRSRALAFVLRSQSDLHFTLNPDDAQGALKIVNEAISLAQHGGHEDQRVIAILTRVRMQVKTNNGEEVFNQLDFAERYANRMDIPRIACEVHELRARHLFQQGETVLSAKEATASLEISGLYALKLMKARAMLTLARIYLSRGDLNGARALVETGKQIATASDYYSCVRGFGQLEMKLASSGRV